MIGTVIQLLIISYLTFLSIFLLSKNRSKAIIYFASFCLGLVGWNASLIVLDRLINLEVLGLVGKLPFVFIIVAVFSLLMFVYEFPEENTKFKWVIRILRGMLVAGFFLSMTNLVVSGVYFENGEANPERGSLYGMVITAILLSLLSSMLILVYKFKHSKGISKLRFQYLLYGTAMMILILITTNMILPVFQDNQSAAFIGPLGLIPLTLAVSVSILRQRLFDLKLVIGKILTYSVISVFIYITFFVTNEFQSYFLDLNLDSIGVVFVLGIIFTLTYILSGLYGRLERIILGGIFNAKYDWFSIVSEFGEVLNSVLILDQVGDEIVSKLSKLFEVKHVELIVYDLSKKSIRIRSTSSEKETEASYWEKNLKLLKHNYSEKMVFGEDKLGNRSSMKKLQNILFESEFDAVIHIDISEKSSGYIFVGSKYNEEPFTVEDEGLMEALSSQIRIALGRSILYDDARNFNTVLKAQVYNATRKLKKANAELKEMDSMKDDLISIASHELRTPASIVKGRLYLLRKKIDKIKKKRGFDKGILEDIGILQRANNRQIEQVNTLLEASRIGKSTVVLEPQKVNLITLVKESTQDFQTMAEDKNLKLNFHPPKRRRTINASVDIKRIRQVTDNLITNAIKYTDSGKIDVFLTVDKHKAKLEIRDTGIGIQKEDIPMLWDKFYRVDPKNHKTNLVKPGGTGLGLYVAKNIIELHKGKIDVNSKIGSGSSFVVIIPVL